MKGVDATSAGSSPEPAPVGWHAACDAAVADIVEVALAHMKAQPSVEAAREIRSLLDRAPRHVQVRGLAKVAEVLSNKGQHEEALAVAGEGLAMAQDLGDGELELLHRRLRRRLGRCGISAVQGWAALTPAEWRVVQQVTTGRTYAEIGERLFVSRRTVEAHVASVFRKLGVATRQQLQDAHRSRQRGGHRPGTSTAARQPLSREAIGA